MEQEDSVVRIAASPGEVITLPIEFFSNLRNTSVLILSQPSPIDAGIFDCIWTNRDSATRGLAAIMRYKIILFLTLLALYACAQPQQTSSVVEPAAVVLVNATQNKVGYKTLMDSEWGAVYFIDPGFGSFLFNYARTSKNELVPQKLETIVFIMSGCELELSRKDIESYMTQDPEGNPGWGLYLTEELVQEVGCK